MSDKSCGWTIKKLAELVGGELVGAGDTKIFRAASFENARQNEISFLEKVGKVGKVGKNGFSEFVQKTSASCVLVPENLVEKLPCSIIRVKNPKLAFAKIGEVLHEPKRKPGVHQTAQIADSAKIGKDVFVGAFACIGENSEIGDRTQIFEGVKIAENVKIGADCFVYPNVVIYENVSIGSGAKLHAGVCIGADGFGFVRDLERYVKFPQIGTVVIEDDVEIGANSCVDRGALGETHIGKGTKIDNLVQIAHNVSIGERVVIAAQTGISGSTVIEDDCVIGGQVGMGDHARVLKGAIIGSQAGVLPNKIVRAGVWWGTPVQPLDEYKRQNAHLKGIARLKEELKEIKKQISALENKINE